jgi:hypothetical protein
MSVISKIFHCEIPTQTLKSLEISQVCERLIFHSVFRELIHKNIRLPHGYNSFYMHMHTGVTYVYGGQCMTLKH